MNITKLQYLDGNGNIYNITKDSISYIPVKREMSSSGMYDGGKEICKRIELCDFDILLNQFEIIFRNKKIQIKDRIMTSGLLIKYDNETKIEQIIISKSDEQFHLEEKLKSILK